MRVISIGKLKECWERHPDARIPLYEWYVKVCKAQWKSFADIKKDFNCKWKTLLIVHEWREFRGVKRNPKEEQIVLQRRMKKFIKK